jgi:hypothetical protein
MEIIREIGLQVIEILTLIFGILGITFSAMLMVSPKQTKSLSKVLNRNVDVDDKISFLDKGIDISDYFYGHHVVVGFLLMAGSAFALFFFYVSLDTARFSKIFFGSQHELLWGEILFSTLLWIGKITCFAGLLFGSILLFLPKKMKRIENSLNVWFETNSMFKKLDQPSNNVDSFFFRYPRPVGITGVALSFLILCLSIINLLD